MPDYIHRVTLDFVKSVAPADMPEPLSDWIEYPDLSTLFNVDKKYWKSSGDSIIEMTPTEKSDVDTEQALREKNATEEESQRGILKAVIKGLVDVINTKLPGNKQITYSEVRAAIRSEL